MASKKSAVAGRRSLQFPASFRCGPLRRFDQDVARPTISDPRHHYLDPRGLVQTSVQRICIPDRRTDLASHHLILPGEFEFKSTPLRQDALKLAVENLFVFAQVILTKPCQAIADLADIRESKGVISLDPRNNQPPGLPRIPPGVLRVQP